MTNVIRNGDFATDLANWSNVWVGTVTATWVAGEAQLVTPANTESAYNRRFFQSVTVTAPAPAHYRARFRARALADQVLNVAFGAQRTVNITTVMRSYDLVFPNVAPQTLSYIYALAGINAQTTVYVDDVELELIAGLTVRASLQSGTTWRFLVTGWAAGAATITVGYGDGTSETKPVDNAAYAVYFDHTYPAGLHTVTLSVTAGATTIVYNFDMDAGTVTPYPATFLASIIAGTPISQVQLAVQLLDPSTVYAWQIWRDSPGDSTLVYTSDGAVVAMTVIDQTAPLGVPLTYRLVLTLTNGSTMTIPAAPVTITGTTGCYLTDPATSTTIPVTLVEWPSRTRGSRMTLLDVLGRADPIGLVDAHRTPSGQWRIYTATDDAGAALDGVLDSLSPIVLRSQPGSSIKPVTVLVDDYTETRYTGRGGDQRRMWTVNVQEVAQLPAGAFPLPATLNGLDRYVSGTLLDMAALRPTLLQLSQIPVGS